MNYEFFLNKNAVLNPYPKLANETSYNVTFYIQYFVFSGKNEFKNFQNHLILNSIFQKFELQINFKLKKFPLQA